MHTIARPSGEDICKAKTVSKVLHVLNNFTVFKVRGLQRCCRIQKYDIVDITEYGKDIEHSENLEMCKC